MTQSSTKATQKTIASPVRMSDDAVAGAFAGIVARLVSAPFDVIKIRFQLQDPVNPKYRSLVQAFSTVVREEGLFSLWKGNISATYLWISYAMVQFTMYGVLKRMGESILEAREASSVPISSAGSGSKSTVEYRANTSSNSIKRAVLLFLAGAGAG